MFGKIFNKLKAKCDAVLYKIGGVLEVRWNIVDAGLANIPKWNMLHTTGVKIINYSLVALVKITKRRSKRVASTIAQFSHVPFNTAVAEYDKETIQTLLEGGFDINALSGNNITPLQTAVAGGRPHMIDHLLKNGALLSYPYNVLIGSGNTLPLTIAIHNNQFHLPRFLFPKIDQIDSYGILTAMHHQYFNTDEMMRLMGELFGVTKVIDRELIKKIIDNLQDIIQKKMAEAINLNKKLLVFLGESHYGIESYVIMVCLLYLMPMFNIQTLAFEAFFKQSDLLTVYDPDRPLRTERFRAIYYFLEKNSGIKYRALETFRFLNMTISERDAEMANNLQNIHEHCLAIVGAAHIEGIIEKHKEKLEKYVICPIVCLKEIELLCGRYYLQKSTKVAKVNMPGYLHVDSFSEFRKVADETLELERSRNAKVTATTTRLAVEVTNGDRVSIPLVFTGKSDSKEAAEEISITFSRESGVKREKLSSEEAEKVVLAQPEKAVSAQNFMRSIGKFN